MKEVERIEKREIRFFFTIDKTARLADSVAISLARAHTLEHVSQSSETLSLLLHLLLEEEKNPLAGMTLQIVALERRK